MASPFSLFRKNQRIMMVVIGVGCMVGFLLGGMGIIEGIRPGMGGGGSDADKVVVTFNGGSLTEQDLDRLRGRRAITLRYLADIARQAIKNGGTPKGPGVAVSQNRMSLGIPQDTSDEDIVYTYLLAQKAKEKGFTVTDDDVNRFLLQVSDESISLSDFERTLKQVAGDNMTDAQLFESLRYELLSVKMRMLGRESGLAFSTPGELWQYYNRLNRQIEAELIAVPVADFTDKVPVPATSQLKDFYERHKNAASHPQLPTPGFRERQRLAFGYFQANLDDFMEGPSGALAQVTDEEIEAYYEENKDRLFRERELPNANDAAPGDAADSAAPGETELAPPANSEAQPDTPADPATPPADDPPADDPPATDPPADNPPASDPPASDPAATDPPASEPAPEEPASDAPPAADESDSSQRREHSPGTALFVSYLLQDEEPSESEAPAATDDRPEEAAPADETPAPTAPAAGDQPAPPAADDDQAAPPAAGEQPVADEPPAAAADQPPADPGIEAPTAEPPQPKYTPLEKVRDEIRRNLATPKANEQMKNALAQAEERMQKYTILHSDLAALAQFKDDKQFAAEYEQHLKRAETERPDFKAIASELGLTYGETPLVDEFQIEDYPLGKVSTFDRNTFQQIPFATLVYGQNVQFYKPVSLGEQRDEQYLYWITDHKEPRVPSFTELYDEAKKSGPLLEAWKKQQALPLAKSHAEQLAAESNKTQQLLEEQFHGRDDITVLKTNPFSWLSTGGMPLGFGQLQISLVAGAESAGSEFMEAAFSLDIGQAGVGVNQPHTVVYVIHVVGQTPSSEHLRTEFARMLLPPETQQSDMAMRSDMMQQQAIGQIAMADRYMESQQWFEELQREMNVQWNP